MQVVVQRCFGPPEVLEVEQRPDPVPGPGQVRIAVAAAGVHLVDTVIRAGHAGGPFVDVTLPFVGGREVEGTVVEVGPGVDGGVLGRRVTAHLGLASGGYASQVVVAAEALLDVPATLQVGAGVALVGTGRTTVAILDRAPLRPGDVALVLAALGDREVTAVFDGVGGPVGTAAFELAGPGAHVVLYGDASGTPTTVTADGVVGRGLTVTSPLGPRLAGRPRVLRDLAARALSWAAEGWFVPTVDDRWRLTDAAAAHRALEERRTTGKVVLRP
ncbi:zinc-binding dehydrogenase [Nitriliruptoraceae bacterium ZYF776]|nr:zinc-binding dehydrogenase [Profundirhabdus halotolerans]